MEYGNALPFSPRKGNSQPPLLRKPSQKSKQSPLLLPRPPSDACPQPIHAWAFSMPHTRVLLCFYLWCTAGISKLQILKDPARCGPVPLLQEKSLAMLFLEPLCHRESSRPGFQVPGVYDEVLGKATTRLLALCALFLSPAIKWPLSGAHWVPCPWRDNIPSSKYTLGGGTFFPSATQGIPTLHCLPSTPWSTTVCLA